MNAIERNQELVEIGYHVEFDNPMVFKRGEVYIIFFSEEGREIEGSLTQVYAEFAEDDQLTSAYPELYCYLTEQIRTEGI